MLSGDNFCSKQIIMLVFHLHDHKALSGRQKLKVFINRKKVYTLPQINRDCSECVKSFTNRFVRTTCYDLCLNVNENPTL